MIDPTPIDEISGVFRGCFFVLLFLVFVGAVIGALYLALR